MIGDLIPDSFLSEVNNLNHDAHVGKKVVRSFLSLPLVHLRLTHAWQPTTHWC